MRVHLTEQRLRRRAHEVLGHGPLLGLAGEHLFDPHIPPPPFLPRLRGFPSFRDLLRTVPPPYIDLICHAYVEMNNFATLWCPPLCRVVDSEPFHEWLMHADLFNEHYRDHVVHQVRVGAIGDLLLQEQVGGQALVTWAADALSNNLAGLTANPERFVRLAWWYTALFHDCGYAYQTHCQANQRIQETYQTPLSDVTNVYWSKPIWTLEKLTGAIEAVDLEARREGKHQFVGACEIALEEADYEHTAGRHEDPLIRRRRRTLIGLAARAVLRHHGKRDGGRKITFQEDPIGFLLVLADELHEGHRPLNETHAEPPRIPTKTDWGRTVLKYRPGDLHSSSAFTTRNKAGGDKLNLRFFRWPRRLRIRGHAPEVWAAEKKRTLEQLLDFNRDGPFDDLDVQVQLRPAGS